MTTSKEYYKKNKKRISEYNKNRYIGNKEKLIEYQKQYRTENRQFLSNRDKLKRHQRQLQAIEILGGCCNRCGEKFDPVCYDFHHIDPSQKDLTLGQNMLVGKEKFFNEIKKCILLCSNCHRITHKELRNNAN